MIELSAEAVTYLMLGGVFVLVMTGFPIAFVIGSVAFFMGLAVFGPTVTFHILYSRFYDLSLNYPYLAVPLFTFMGVILQHSGVTKDLYQSLYEAMGRLRGGLAVVTIVFGTILAACLGVIAASVTILTLIALAPMITRGYDKSLASGSIVAAGTLGILIPPSIMLVVYAPQAGLSVGQMFMGAVFPGLLLSAFYILYVVVRCRLNPALGPAIPEDQITPFDAKKLIRLLKSLVPPVLLIVAVLGTIFAGIAPPTEAAAVGCFAAILLAVVYRRFSWGLMRQAMIVAMGMQQVGGVDRHRAVEIDRDLGQSPRRFQLPEVIEKGLGAADREGRDDDGATPLDGALDDRAQRLGRVDGIVDAVAIGGFDNDKVRLRNGSRIGKDRGAVAPEIPRKRDAAAAPFHVGACRAEDVARMAERQGRAAGKLNGIVERHH